MNTALPTSPPSAHAEQIRLMKERIHLLKEVNKALYQNTHPVNDRKTRYNHSETSRSAHLPPLPPTLPRPEYSLTADLISLDDEEVHFYIACANGSLQEVTSFIQKTLTPSQAILQHGLEQASFGNQPAVAQYLLERDTPLHDNVFSRARRITTKDSSYLEDSSILDCRSCIREARAQPPSPLPPFNMKNLAVAIPFTSCSNALLILTPLNWCCFPTPRQHRRTRPPTWSGTVSLIQASHLSSDDRSTSSTALTDLTWAHKQT